MFPAMEKRWANTAAPLSLSAENAGNAGMEIQAAAPVDMATLRDKTSWGRRRPRTSATQSRAPASASTSRAARIVHEFSPLFCGAEARDPDLNLLALPATHVTRGQTSTKKEKSEKREGVPVCPGLRFLYACLYAHVLTSVTRAARFSMKTRAVRPV